MLADGDSCRLSKGLRRCSMATPVGAMVLNASFSSPDGARRRESPTRLPAAARRVAAGDRADRGRPDAADRALPAARPDAAPAAGPAAAAGFAVRRGAGAARSGERRGGG